MPGKQKLEERRAKKQAYFRAYRLAHSEEEKAYRLVHLEERKASNKAYYSAHQEELRARMKAYRQSHREELKAYAKAYRLAHPEEEKTRCKAYRLAHQEEVRAKNQKRRALKRGVAIGTIDIKFIRARDGMRCGVCHKKVHPTDLSLDHIVPLSKGGTHTTQNIQVAHKHCNSVRGVGRIPAQLRMV